MIETDDAAFSVEDIIMSLYGMEVLLKRLKERQTRTCFYDWKYKCMINKELNLQKKKYNKYMFDGFYALTRQTQSICMLFHIIRMSENKLKKHALNKLLTNVKNDKTSNDASLVSIDEAIIQEFQCGIMRIINGFSSLSFIINSKRFKAVFCSFYVLLNYRREEPFKNNTESENQLDETKDDTILWYSDVKSNTNDDSNLWGHHNSDKIINLENKENNALEYNRKKNEKCGLNNGLFINKNYLYAQNNSDCSSFYTRKQNASFNNGYYAHIPVNTQTRQVENYNDLLQGNYNNIRINSISEFPPSTILYPSLKPQISNRDEYLNVNFANPILNKRLSPINSNTNSFQTSNSVVSTAAPSPLNTTKYSAENLYFSMDYRNNKRSDFKVKNTIYEKKAQKLSEPSKNFINPCMNFAQDSSIILNNITDTFKSVIMN